MTFPHQPGYKYDPDNVITRQTADIIAHPLFENLLEAIVDFKSKIPGASPSVTSSKNVEYLARKARELFELEVDEIEEDPILTDFIQEAIEIFKRGSEQLASINSMEAKFLQEYDMNLKEGTLWDIHVQLCTIRNTVDIVKKTEKRLSSAVQAVDEREREEPSKKKKRGRFNKEVTELLVSWLLEHQHNPYPTATEKEVLASSTGLDVNQIQNWFINMRKRHLAPLKNGKRNPRSFLDFVLRSNAVAQQSSAVTNNRFYQHTTPYHNPNHMPVGGPRQMYQQPSFPSGPPPNMQHSNHYHHNGMGNNQMPPQQHNMIYDQPPPHAPGNQQYNNMQHNHHLGMKSENYGNSPPQQQGMQQPMMQYSNGGPPPPQYDTLSPQQGHPPPMINENGHGTTDTMIMPQQSMQNQRMQHHHPDHQSSMGQGPPMPVNQMNGGVASYSGLQPDDERKMREFEDLLERIAGTEDSMQLFDEFSPSVEMHQV